MLSKGIVAVVLAYIMSSSGNDDCRDVCSLAF